MPTTTHTSNYRVSSPGRSLPSPSVEGGSPALYALLAVSAFLGFVVVPGGALLATLMILAASGWVLWVLLWAASSLMKRLFVAAAVVGRRKAHEPRRVAASGRRSGPSFRRGQLARSEV